MSDSSGSLVELIESKRDDEVLSDADIHRIIDAYTSGDMPDYQMSALLMAVYFNGMSDAELATWTQAMLDSGDRIDLSDHPPAKVDKHSTGGVGDKVSIPLAPLVAACGVAVPMMSGRGLGHTGGTLDKLESIAGFATRIDPDEFVRLVKAHNYVMAGQSATLAPADRRLYALRDATGTVPSIPLIASSIMSKKLAEGLDALVLDVKTGVGAFMQDIEEARTLARTMVSLGASHGVRTRALITAMSQPLGDTVGNANELAESILTLRGEGPDDLTELVVRLGAEMLIAGGVVETLDDGQSRITESIESGAGLRKFQDIIGAQGGDTAVITDLGLLPKAADSHVISAMEAGYVRRCDARAIGVGATRLGAGRSKAEDTVDPAVGVRLHAKIGAEVRLGTPLATVDFNDEARLTDALEILNGAWEIDAEPTDPGPLVLDAIGD